MSVDVLLSRLGAVKQMGPMRWMAKCPAHEDKTPSLSVRQLDDGQILINDFGGCGAVEVLAAAGLGFDDLYPPKAEQAKGLRGRRVFTTDVFELIHHEATIIWLIACDTHKGRAVSEDDYQRLGEAVAKLERIREAAYGQR